MESLARTGGNMCHTSGLLTATGSETVYDTTVAIQFDIDGVFSTAKAAVTDGATPTTDGNTGAAFEAVLPDKGCAFLWCMQADGTVTLSQGAIQDMDPDSDTFKIEPQFPPVPANEVPFAYMIYSCDGTSSASGLKPGTDNWDATGLTVSIKNLSRLPSRPRTA